MGYFIVRLNAENFQSRNMASFKEERVLSQWESFQSDILDIIFINHRREVNISHSESVIKNTDFT